MTKEVNFEAPVIDDKEFSTAVQAAQKKENSTYIHEFSAPFSCRGTVYKTMVFDWDSLTGDDFLEIEDELAAIGKVAVVPQFSGQFLVRMAAKASRIPIGADDLGKMSIGDFNKIRSVARSFLLKSEL